MSYSKTHGVVFAFVFSITVLATGLLGTNFAYAQSVPVPSGIPFGGVLSVVVLPTVTCPLPHVLVYDFRSSSIIGLTVLPGSRVYRNGNIAKPGTLVLGTYIPTPMLCLLPYPIFPISQVGTSL